MYKTNSTKSLSDIIHEYHPTCTLLSKLLLNVQRMSLTLLLRPLAGAKYCNQFVCQISHRPITFKHFAGVANGTAFALFQTAGVYAGNMELVLSPSFRTLAILGSEIWND